MGKKLLPVQKIEFDAEDMVPKWYVMNAQYQDKYASTLMDTVKSRGLENQIFEVFIPTRTYEETIEKDGKVKKVKRKEHVWPNNYVLIRLVMNGTTWNLCKSVSYGMGWLNAGNRPRSLTDVEVVELKKLCGVLEEVKTQAKVNFNGQVGDVVSVTNHAFAGKAGYVSAVKGDTITVTLDNGFKLDLEAFQVMKAKEQNDV